MPVTIGLSAFVPSVPSVPSIIYTCAHAHTRARARTHELGPGDTGDTGDTGDKRPRYLKRRRLLGVTRTPALFAFQKIRIQHL